MRQLALLLVLMIVPPFVIHFTLIAGELFEVVQTGQCPAAPPDISAYKCTGLEFYSRMLFGGFAFVGTALIFIVWQPILGGFVALYVVASRKMKEYR